MVDNYYLKNIQENYRQISTKVFDMIGRKGDVVSSTDQYIPESVKSMERCQRGCGEKLILRGETTKRPPDWKSFLSNDENKVQFIKLLLILIWRSQSCSGYSETVSCMRTPIFTFC